MRFKKLQKDIITPSKSYPGDAGIDLYSPADAIIYPREFKQIKLGIAIEISNDEVAMTSERSGMAIKYGVTSIGNVIDSGYTGEISIILANVGSETFKIEKGDRIGQLLIHKLGDRYIEEVDKISETMRGDKAHYSSGL